MRKSAQKLSKGFTLVELLVVIAIVIILAVVVFTVINPLELTKQGRDATRLSDISALQNAIGVAIQEATASGTGSILCKNLPTGAACNGASSTGTRASDGTGWVKVDLSTNKAYSLPVLPVDPINDAVYQYEYATNATQDAWELNAHLESSKYSERMTKDGGNNDTRWEIGSSLTVIN